MNYRWMLEYSLLLTLYHLYIINASDMARHSTLEYQHFWTIHQTFEIKCTCVYRWRLQQINKPLLEEQKHLPCSKYKSILILNPSMKIPCVLTNCTACFILKDTLQFGTYWRRNSISWLSIQCCVLILLIITTLKTKSSRHK